ncbi:uncharacterized protein LOC100208815 isoform X2 [Hydra vulgaris]|uniref:Uncharacterized protein LOC100208815 isoform X2 n=1 Tax=Hydra vulgaris TaxID=6087 RepID=A0ABM4CBK5_HYDVU
MDIERYQRKPVTNLIREVLRSILLILFLAIFANPLSFQSNVATSVATGLINHITRTESDNNKGATLKTLIIGNESLNILFLYTNSSFNKYKTDGKESCSFRIKLTKRCELLVKIFGLDQISNIVSFYNPFFTQWKKKGNNYQNRQDNWLTTRVFCSNKTFVIVHNFTLSHCNGSNVNKNVILVANSNGSNEYNKLRKKKLVLGVSEDKKFFILPMVLICIVTVVFVVFLSIGVIIRSSRQRRHRLQQTEEAVFDFRYNKTNHKECCVSRIVTTLEKITNPFLVCAKVCLKHLNLDVSTENDNEDFVIPKCLSNETRKISYYGTIHMNLSQKKQPIMADFCEETESDQSVKITLAVKPKLNFHNRQLSLSV